MNDLRQNRAAAGRPVSSAGYKQSTPGRGKTAGNHYWISSHLAGEAERKQISFIYALITNASSVSCANCIDHHSKHFVNR